MTTTVTSFGVRQTPGFTVPSTQNTAPVLDYRCLFTHDLRRKQKRWQDGLLRFHTFNKRIMVYDVSRNYIGDMHRRKDEVLQDGDEFELDMGVLIQVGEATGSIEQDLTGLLEKRKKAPEVVVNDDVSHQPSAVPTARPTAAQPSQLRPKTLNALLGTPKGRIGRALLPTKSPHELRTENENVSWNHDRPAKRQRIESQSEKNAKSNTVPAPQTPAIFRVPGERVDKAAVGAVIDKRSEEGSVPTIVRNPDLSSAGNAANRPTTPLISRSKNNKEDEASERAVEPLPKKRSSGPQSSAPTKQQRKRKPNQDAQVSPKAKKITNGLDHEPETEYATTRTITKPIEIDGDEDAASTNEQPKQRLKLQMASRKPRKKLMYRDLLPQESSATGWSGDASVLDRGSRDRSTSRTSDKRTKDPMAEFHKEEQDRLKARLIRHHAKEIHRESEREEFCGEAPEELFLSQEDITSATTNHHRTKEEEQIENLPKPSMTISRRRDNVPIHSSLRPSSSPQVLPQVIPRPPSTVHSTAEALAKMDELLLPRPESRTPDSVEDKDGLPEVLPQETSPPPVGKAPPDVVCTPSPPKDRPGSSPAFQTALHPPRRKPDSLPAFTKVIPTKPRSPLKKAASDTSAMRPPSALAYSGGNEKGLGEGEGVDGKEETASLWSKEAWDLFGCDRDGVECTYEEFKRKEGLL